ncbi:MAG: L,D-transpeptidase [Myxococcales bacterium]|nr:L,D-transpeptidase [Myxococcales bacterium]
MIRRPSVGHIYVDLEGRAVPGRDLQVQKPSELVGRELAEEPAAGGLTPAWSVSLPAILMDGPGTRRSKEVGKIDYHTRFDVDPEPLGRPGSIWYRVPGAGKEGADAFVEASQIRLWVPGPPRPEGVGDDERWLDVDVDQQMLAVMRGDRPTYITLVSTGTGKHPTPRGVFRIRNKLALGKMENKPDDPDSYYVEEVPWVLYFYKRFAFHATYWHRSLGRRRSHGCINLAPRDAARVFELTSPAMPEGWTSVYEHEGEVGTIVRVRKGDDPLPDRRRPLGEEEDEDDGADEPPEEGASDDEDGEGP